MTISETQPKPTPCVCDNQIAPSESQQPSQMSPLVMAMIALSFFKFIWAIVLITTVPNVITLFGIAGIIYSVYAMKGFPGGFSSIWFGVDLGLDAVLLIVSCIRALAFHLNLFMYVALGIWAVILIAEIVIYVVLRKRDSEKAPTTSNIQMV